MTRTLTLALVTLGLAACEPLTLDELALVPLDDLAAEVDLANQHARRGACEIVEDETVCGLATTCFWAQDTCHSCPGLSRCDDDTIPIY